MRFAIDVVFFDKSGRLFVQSALAPYRIKLALKARGVIELPVGVIARTHTSTGDELLIDE